MSDLLADCEDVTTMQGFKVFTGLDDDVQDVAVLVDEGDARAFVEDHNEKLWKHLLEQTDPEDGLDAEALVLYRQLDDYFDNLGPMERLRPLGRVENEYYLRRAHSEPITVFLAGEWVA